VAKLASPGRKDSGRKGSLNWSDVRKRVGRNLVGEQRRAVAVVVDGATSGSVTGDERRLFRAPLQGVEIDEFNDLMTRIYGTAKARSTLPDELFDRPDRRQIVSAITMLVEQLSRMVLRTATVSKLISRLVVDDVLHLRASRWTDDGINDTSTTYESKDITKHILTFRSSAVIQGSAPPLEAPVTTELNTEASHVHSSKMLLWQSIESGTLWNYAQV
jgi:hypothetical protein